MSAGTILSCEIDLSETCYAIRSNNLVLSTTLPGFQSLEKLGITTFSVGVTLELLDFIRRFRKRAPKMDCVELSSTEIFRHSNVSERLKSTRDPFSRAAES